MATIKDIAKLAGVSPMTVSNVLHKRYNKVSEDTIERINTIAKQYNYTPNLSARSLVSKSSHVIAYINIAQSSSTRRFVSDPFNAELINTLENELGKSGYYLMLKTVTSPDELTEFLKNWSIDGIFCVGLSDNSFISEILSTKIPSVFIDSHVPENCANICLDNRLAAQLAAECFVKNGHRKIAAAIPKHSIVDNERIEGFIDTLHAMGIDFSAENLYESHSFSDGGFEIGQILAKKGEISAVFATADLLAAEIISGLHSEGVRVPEDVSVIGFDDSYICNITYPRLTSLHQSTSTRGEFAAKTMLGLLNGDTSFAKKSVLPVSLRVRDSVYSKNT
ncbi:MAG: LacI family DNA-binding transcriptional regulator [Clostridia bacterium]|nr:LacI family DNA-binding transcriptional regulator [Clostridia bacterium]